MQILHSKIIGKGVPLLILHGYFGMSDNWKSLGNKFAEGFQTHLIDQRNHGRSFHENDFNYDCLADDLFRYVIHHNLKKIVLLGHSMGGKTAMLFAVKYPNFLDKLIVADISPRYYQPHHNEILKALNSVNFTNQNTRKLVDQKITELIPDIGVRSFLLKNVYWKEKGILGYRFNLKSLTDNNIEVGKELPPNTSFKGKVLFISAGDSGYINNDDLFLIKAHFPNSSVTIMSDVGHWLHAENPNLFHKLVINFIS
ncbi:alpha/beta fold hydrolase [Flavobacteriaceae bacterium]|nr:alpha/beta fold hydrolase [Flavobacteriaceae bacterium]MDC3345008.1 alpha/beta fold hydrolase [Flavobacteriaceae bacterium]